MTNNSESVQPTDIDFQLEDDRFDQTSMAMHWLTVLLIVVQFTSIWAHEAVEHHGNLAAALLSLHRSTGVLTWFVTAMRLVWRRYFAHVPPFPPDMTEFQQTMAMANEYSLYILLLAMPITGLMRTLLRGQPFDLFVWQVPALLRPDPAVRGLFAEAHEVGAMALMFLIALHAGAALFHRLVLRDGVLQRMLPRRPARSKLTPTLVKSRAE
jgi:superoxide oxidase